MSSEDSRDGVFIDIALGAIAAGAKSTLIINSMRELTDAEISAIDGGADTYYDVNAAASINELIKTVSCSFAAEVRNQIRVFPDPTGVAFPTMLKPILTIVIKDDELRIAKVDVSKKGAH
jgi:hypothetical protein